MADDDKPVTKNDLNAAFEAQRGWIEERLEAVETRVLTAFHRYTEGNHGRMLKVEAEQHIDGERLTKLEVRVQALEERLDFPRQPPGH